MASLRSGSIDMVMTSPPYDNLREYGESFTDWGPHIWKPCIQSIARLLKQGGVCVWVVNDATIKGSETGTSFRQALWAMECGLSNETMIWEKTGSGCLGSNKFYAQNFEFMFVFTKGTPTTSNLIKDRENKIKTGVVRTSAGIGVSGRGTTRTIQRKPFGKRTNIWRVDPQRGSNHPAPYPEKLAHDHIVSWSNKGEIILDPFMGSGTTGAVCKRLERKFIGIEIDKAYFEIARRRIKKAYQ